MTVFSTATNVGVMVYGEDKGGDNEDGAKEDRREMKLKDFCLECSCSCCTALGSHVLILFCGKNILPDYISHHTS